MLFLVVERIGLPKQSKRKKMGASTPLSYPFFKFFVTPNLDNSIVDTPQKKKLFLLKHPISTKFKILIGF